MYKYSQNWISNKRQRDSLENERYDVIEQLIYLVYHAIERTAHT